MDVFLPVSPQATGLQVSQVGRLRSRRGSNGLAMSRAYASVCKIKPLTQPAVQQSGLMMTDQDLQEVALAAMALLVENNPRSIELMLQHYDKGD